MSAEFDTGFSVREVPWHRQGLVLSGYPGSWAEVRRLAGLEWDPVERGVYDAVEMYADGTAKVELIPNFKQVIRSDNGAVLDIAMDTYHLIDHDTMGDIFETVRGQAKDLIQFQTAGSLQGGKKVWALARVGDEIELPGDPSPMQPYMALLNAHDGTAALRVINTNVRIVCMNTWHAAEMGAERNGSAYAFKHTKNWRDQVEQAKTALATTRAQIEHTVAEAEAMLAVKVTALQRQEFIRQFAIKRTIANTVGRKALSTQALAKRLDDPRTAKTLAATVAGLTNILDSRTCTGINDTVWGLVQAAGEFTDHHREAKTDDTRLSRTMFDEREPLKITAVKLAREVLTAA